MSMIIDCGREICGELESAERREWLCTNGIGGFASGTVASTLTRRYHGLLVAALAPPLGRTLLGTKVDETVEYEGLTLPLFANRWTGNAIDPHGYRAIERFTLDGTIPVWIYAVADARIEKRVWMEQGANTTYVRYRVLRARGRLVLTVKLLVNYRDYHGTTRAGDWRMDIAPIEHGLRVSAFDGASPLVALAGGADARVSHAWYRGFDLAAERERGLDATEDHLHAGTFSATLAAGKALTLVLSTESRPALDGEQALTRQAQHEARLVAAWKRVQSAARQAPDWVEHLVLTSDQFIAKRPLPDDADGMTVIAGYHWFGDWGRDTMVALPGLTLATGRPEIARRILRTFARFLDRGMLPNRFPDAGETPEYHAVDATLWYFEAIRAYHESTGDGTLLEELFPLLDEIVRWHREGTRYGIKEDSADGLLRSGEPGVQLTWMDARVGDWVVTPRTGKGVEINALWYNALCSMAAFAQRLGMPSRSWNELAARVRAGFGGFWYGRIGLCHEVVTC